MFNPYFQHERKYLRDQTNERLPGLPEGYVIEMGGHEPQGKLCPHVCLVVDKASLKSIIRDRNPFVIAVDAIDHLPDDNPPWDGTFRLSTASIFDEFYLRTVSSNVLTMVEVRPHAPNGVWTCAEDL